MFAEYFKKPEDLRVHVESWNDLAVTASDANPFFESWCLLPALSHLHTSNVQVLVIWEDHTRQKMLGLVPLSVEKQFRGLPIKRTTIWRHDYCFLSNPLIAADHVNEVLKFMFISIANNQTLPSFMSLYWLENESSVARAVTNRGVSGFEAKGKTNVIARAMLTSVGDYEKDFTTTINKKKRKELNRNRNRLSELGALATVVIDSSKSESEIESAIQAFFILENQGWKRDQQTAIACNANHQSYFEDSLRSGIKNGGAYIVTMVLNEETIASVVLIQSSNKTHAYSVKIASDGQYQQYSLGSLLMLEVSNFAFEHPDILQVDSCAASDHPMINRLWRERKEIVNINVTQKNDYRGAVVPMMDYCVELVRRLQSVKA